MYLIEFSTSDRSDCLSFYIIYSKLWFILTHMRGEYLNDLRTRY